MLVKSLLFLKNRPLQRAMTGQTMNQMHKISCRSFNNSFFSSSGEENNTTTERKQTWNKFESQTEEAPKKSFERRSYDSPEALVDGTIYEMTRVADYIPLLRKEISQHQQRIPFEERKTFLPDVKDLFDLVHGHIEEIAVFCPAFIMTLY